MQPVSSPLDVEYILPLRWDDDADLDELTDYLTALRAWADVTVVDGSDPERFAAHAAAWAGLLRHVAVDERPGANGKVRGVLTGVAIARHERIVLADDDVRYGRQALDAVVSALDSASLVIPQNHFDPLPWHARWDTGRTLLNRAVGRDWPRTYAVRRSVLRTVGGYDADTLFENLEMERTILAVGGIVQARPDLYVARRPPTTRHFLSQRVRQAYDSFARLALEASALPALCLLRRRPAALALVALGTRLRGGVQYGGQRVPVAAHSVRTIRQRLERENATGIARK
ncbi:glycosyltransferase [Microbacterium hydrocarbonoxydans]|uniref:Glycosyltransferase like family 2 n=1 Tax=Microbacterium hydrocarbonoxydans TaxID=273678 RepID=A0A1H4JK22_9MICO|nr:glycosyltransferase family 2 protein [Microbacterium hydrocarbonoxydans]SEB46674.1 Glycosyltransferase like family 2 [Microbacterium hydrocarbonoxydans]